jgi:sec-independent protein translocase protein TatA
MIGDILQPTHLIFILVVALLVLGPKRLPEVGRSLGRGIRDFRGAMSGLDEAINPDSTPTEQVSPAAVTAPTPVPPVDTAVHAAPSTVVTVPEPEPATVVATSAPAFDTSDEAVAPPAPPAPAMEFDMDAAFAAQPAASVGPAVATQTGGSGSATTAARRRVDSSRSAAAASPAMEHGDGGHEGPDPADYAD